MALLENLDQREIPDLVVSSWAWNAVSASGAAATRTCQQDARIPSQEEGCSEGGPGLFQGRLQVLLGLICRMCCFSDFYDCSHLFMHSHFQGDLVH